MKMKRKPVIELLRKYRHNIFQKHGVPNLLLLLLLIIGLQTNNFKDSFNTKEFFAFEAARELGVFEDFELIFVFLYFTLLLVVERNYFNFDAKKFIKEQITNASKFGYPNIKTLFNFIDIHLADPVELNKNFAR